MPMLLLISFALLQYFNSGYIKDMFEITADNAQRNIPMIVFFILCILLSVFSFIKNLSLIPVLGLLSCCYLLTGMEAANWKWFSTWLAIGLVVYFSYGYRKSKLAKKTL